MSWAEFVIRSLGFRESRKYEAALMRRVAYESHKAQYIFSKKKPPSIDKFWPLEQKKVTVSDALKRKFKEYKQKFKEKQNG